MLQGPRFPFNGAAALTVKVLVQGWGNPAPPIPPRLSKDLKLPFQAGVAKHVNITVFLSRKVLMWGRAGEPRSPGPPPGSLFSWFWGSSAHEGLVPKLPLGNEIVAPALLRHLPELCSTSWNIIILRPSRAWRSRRVPKPEPGNQDEYLFFPPKHGDICVLNQERSTCLSAQISLDSGEKLIKYKKTDYSLSSAKRII